MSDLSKLLDTSKEIKAATAKALPYLEGAKTELDHLKTFVNNPDIDAILAPIPVASTVIGVLSGLISEGETVIPILENFAKIV